MGTAGLVLVAWLFLSVVVFAVEDLLIHTGWLVWNGSPGRDTVARRASGDPAHRGAGVGRKPRRRWPTLFFS